MTDYKVSALTSLAAPATNDLLLIVDIDDVSTPPAGPGGSDKNVTVSVLVQAGAGLVNLGDTMYGGASGVPTQLAGNTTATKKYLTQTGTGSVSAAPGWNTIAAADLPGATTSVQGAVIIDGTAGDIQALAASAAAGSVGKAADAGHVHPNTGLTVIDSTTGDIAAAPATAAAGSVGKAADAGHVHPQPPMFAPTGLTGATSASRYVGATASGAPASGTFSTGDHIVDQSGTVWVCTTGGTSGTWAQLVNVPSTQTISGAKTFTSEVIVDVASGTAFLVSKDGTTTSDGAFYATFGTSGNNGMAIHSTSIGGTAYIVPDVNITAILPAIGGFGGKGIAVGGSTTGTGVAAFVVQALAQTGSGVGNAEFTVQDNHLVSTFHSTLDDGSGNATFSGTVNLAAGTTSLAPAKFPSGTLLTTATAGAAEFDGTAFYLTSVASSRQVVDTEQFQCLSSPYTLANNTSAQKIFNASTNGALTVAASTTYFFECLLNITALSGSAHTVNFGFGGTAGFTSIMYEAMTATLTNGAVSNFPVAVATASAIIASTSNTVLFGFIKGVMRISTAGTIIPQITQVTASAAGTVATNSYFRLTPAGSNTVTNVGDWS